MVKRFPISKKKVFGRFGNFPLKVIDIYLPNVIRCQSPSTRYRNNFEWTVGRTVKIWTLGIGKQGIAGSHHFAPRGTQEAPHKERPDRVPLRILKKAFSTQVHYPDGEQYVKNAQFTTNNDIQWSNISILPPELACHLSWHDVIFSNRHKIRILSLPRAHFLFSNFHP